MRYIGQEIKVPESYKLVLEVDNNTYDINVSKIKYNSTSIRDTIIVTKIEFNQE